MLLVITRNAQGRLTGGSYLIQDDDPRRFDLFGTSGVELYALVDGTPITIQRKRIKAGTAVTKTITIDAVVEDNP
jgi:hypothetical protein